MENEIWMKYERILDFLSELDRRVKKLERRLKK